jgi:hypothetical protein
MIMTPEERAEQRRIRAEVQAERDAKALAHAKAHPLTEKEKRRRYPFKRLAEQDLNPRLRLV